MDQVKVKVAKLTLINHSSHKKKVPWNVIKDSQVIAEAMY